MCLIVRLFNPSRFVKVCLVFIIIKLIKQEMNHLNQIELVDVIDTNFISQEPQGMALPRPEQIKVDSLFCHDIACAQYVCYM